MRFTKMQGLGNDYLFVNCFEQSVDDAGAVARAISDRHFGVGADGLILVLPSRVSDVRMRVFNADGREAEMCGNGIRCVAKYAYERGLARANPMRVETPAGVKEIKLEVGSEGKVAAATVDMGRPSFGARSVGAKVADTDRTDCELECSAGTLTATCVSMGNPHAVVFVDDVGAVRLDRLGPELSDHKLFGKGINVHFVQIDSPTEVTMRTWERGSGATLACGTGASAVCAAAAETGRTQRRLTVHLPGGDLMIEWRSGDDHILMTGPAEEVFAGQWPGHEGSQG